MVDPLREMHIDDEVWSPSEQEEDRINGAGDKTKRKDRRMCPHQAKNRINRSKSSGFRVSNLAP